jgi:hypothetical protein
VVQARTASAIMEKARAMRAFFCFSPTVSCGSPLDERFLGHAEVMSAASGRNIRALPCLHL